MALVSYSDSESSDTEPSPAQNAPKAPPTTSKPTFKKVVDRSNPHKIRVNLPEPTNGAKPEPGDEEGPPAKKAKIGAGSLSGFNSFLPAPKRSAATNGRPAGGLGKGVGLKTGATPGFTREPMSVPEGPAEGETGGSDVLDDGAKEDNSWSVLPEGLVLGGESKEQVVPKKGNPTMFRPLSVAKKPQKKKKPTAADGAVPQTTIATPAHTVIEPVKKASLFSTDEGKEFQNGSTATGGAYKPMLYESGDRKAAEGQSGSNPYRSYEDEVENDSTPVANETIASGNNPEVSNSLDDIATDLNLSDSAKRQLFGRNRNKNNQAAINIVNFDTDREYASNELLRQAGEQAQHNPVRSLAPGKHSLKQLVSAASSQKDALEEHFASGRRNKKEAGSKYGW